MQLVVVAFRDHVVEHLQHAAGAAVERELRERQVTLAGTGALRDRGSFVDAPKATQRCAVTSRGLHSGDCDYRPSQVCALQHRGSRCSNAHEPNT